MGLGVGKAGTQEGTVLAMVLGPAGCAWQCSGTVWRWDRPRQVHTRCVLQPPLKRSQDSDALQAVPVPVILGGWGHTQHSGSTGLCAEGVAPRGDCGTLRGAGDLSFSLWGPIQRCSNAAILGLGVVGQSSRADRRPRRCSGFRPRAKGLGYSCSRCHAQAVPGTAARCCQSAACSPSAISTLSVSETTPFPLS